MSNGNFTSDWEEVEDPDITCKECGGYVINFREWEAYGGRRATLLKCQECDHSWWMNGVFS